MITKDQAQSAEKLKSALSAEFAKHPEQFPFTPVLVLKNSYGPPALLEFPADDSEGEEWAMEMVSFYLAVEAELTFFNSVPAGGKSTNAVETIHTAVLRPGNQPWGFQGVLRRDTTPASIDWRRNVVHPHAPILDAIQQALEDVQSSSHTPPQAAVFKVLGAASRAR